VSYRMDLFMRLRSAENATIQSIMSTDLFYRWFYSVNGTRCLVELGQKKDEISALVQTFLSATEHEALWIHLMIVCCPDSEKTGKESDTSDNNKNEDDEKEIVLGIMNTLVNSFKNAKKIKTGLRISHDFYGNAHINMSALENLLVASTIATRLLLTVLDLYVDSKPPGEQMDSFVMDYLLHIIRVPTDDISPNDADKSDLMTKLLSIKLLSKACGIQFKNTSKSRKFFIYEKDAKNREMCSLFIVPAFDLLIYSFKLFEAIRVQLRHLHKTIYELKESVSDLKHEYGILLYDVTGKDDEEDLEVPLSHFLRDNNDLRMARQNLHKSQENLLTVENDNRVLKENFSHLLSFLRFHISFCAHVLVVVYSNNKEEKKTRSVDDAPRFFSLKTQLDRVPWNTTYRDFREVEFSVFRSSFSRILACCACRILPSYQNFFTRDEYSYTGTKELHNFKKHVQSSIARKALNDLVLPVLPWSHEEDKNVEEWDFRQFRSHLHRPLRRRTLDSRLSTALVYWSMINNRESIQRISSWKTRLDEDDSTGELMWPRLIVRSIRSSESDSNNFNYSDGSSPRIQLEYKEYHVSLADESINAFIINDQQSIERDRESLTELYESCVNLCTNRRLSVLFALDLSELVVENIIGCDFGLEGKCLPSLRGNHPLNIVRTLCTHHDIGIPCVMQLVTNSYIPLLVDIIKRSAMIMTNDEDSLVFMLSADILSKVVQGPTPLHTHPSKATVSIDDRDRHMEGEEGDRGRTKARPMTSLEGVVEEEQILSLVQILALMLYSPDFWYYCPMAVHNVAMISSVLDLMKALTYALQSSSIVTEILCTVCQEQFNSSYWLNATIGDHLVGDEDKKDNPLVVNGIAKSYTTIFLFLLQGGPIALVSHLKHYGNWFLSASEIDMCFEEIYEHRLVLECHFIELINVISFFDSTLLELLLDNVNFISDQILKRMSLQDHQWPSLDQVREILERDHSILIDSTHLYLLSHLKEQCILLSKQVIDLGRTDNTGGRFNHASMSNEYILYISMSENGQMCKICSSLLKYAGECIDELIIVNNQNESEDLRLHFLIQCQNMAMFCMDFLNSIAFKRIDILDIIAKQSPWVFEQLPRFICMKEMFANVSHRYNPLALNNRSETSEVVDHNQFLLYFKVGMAMLASRLVGHLCMRHQTCLTLAMDYKCVDALCHAMEDCLSEKHVSRRLSQVWCDQICATFQILVARSVEAWIYAQGCFGLDGLFSLCHRGNETIKKLCVNTMLDKSCNMEPAESKRYVRDFISKGGFQVLSYLLSRSPEVVVGSLRLTKVIAVESVEFRNYALSSEGRVFFARMSMYFKTADTDMQQAICAILDTLSAYNPEALVQRLDENQDVQSLYTQASTAADDLSSCLQGEVPIIHVKKNQTQIISEMSARTLANITNSEESDWLDGGSSPLRKTLQKSGILPSLHP
jgi:hypothetical protein